MARFNAGFSVAEVADSIGCKPATVRWRLLEARREGEFVRRGARGRVPRPDLEAFTRTKKLIIHMWAQGMELRAIAEATQWSLQRVRGTIGNARIQYGPEVVPYRRQP